MLCIGLKCSTIHAVCYIELILILWTLFMLFWPIWAWPIVQPVGQGLDFRILMAGQISQTLNVVSKCWGHCFLENQLPLPITFQKLHSKSVVFALPLNFLNRPPFRSCQPTTTWLPIVGCIIRLCGWLNNSENNKIRWPDRCGWWETFKILGIGSQFLNFFKLNLIS